MFFREKRLVVLLLTYSPGSTRLAQSLGARRYVVAERLREAVDIFGPDVEAHPVESWLRSCSREQQACFVFRHWENPSGSCSQYVGQRAK